MRLAVSSERAIDGQRAAEVFTGIVYLRTVKGDAYVFCKARSARLFHAPPPAKAQAPLQFPVDAADFTAPPPPCRNAGSGTATLLDVVLVMPVSKLQRNCLCLACLKMKNAGKSGIKIFIEWTSPLTRTVPYVSCTSRSGIFSVTMCISWTAER